MSLRDVPVFVIRHRFQNSESNEVDSIPALLSVTSESIDIQFENDQQQQQQLSSSSSDHHNKSISVPMDAIMFFAKTDPGTVVPEAPALMVEFDAAAAVTACPSESSKELLSWSSYEFQRLVLQPRSSSSSNYNGMTHSVDDLWNVCCAQVATFGGDDDDNEGSGFGGMVGPTTTIIEEEEEEAGGGWTGFSDQRKRPRQE